MRLLARRPARRVTLYGKPGCHLCEDALALLHRFARRYRLEIEEVDISRNPEIFRRYDIRIPVIVLPGGEEIDAPITEQKLRRALR